VGMEFAVKTVRVGFHFSIAGVAIWYRLWLLSLSPNRVLRHSSVSRRRKGVNAGTMTLSGDAGAWSLSTISDVGSQLSNTAFILSLLAFFAISYLSLFFSISFAMVRTVLAQIFVSSFYAP
jgi:hypothetical protein